MLKKELLMNKVFGIALLLVSFIPVLVYHDGTILLFTGPLGVCLFLSRENHITL